MNLSRTQPAAMRRGISRRALLAGTAILTLSGGRLAGVSAQEAPTRATPSGEPEAVQRLNDAAVAMSELDTFAFDIVTARGETTILEGFALTSISGAVRRPSDFETTVSVEIPFASLDLTAVAIDGEIWIEMPSFGGQTGGWQTIGSAQGLLSLLNPDLLILEAVRYIDDASIDRTGNVAGADVTFVTGSVDFRAIASQLTGGGDELTDEIAEGPVDVTVAIDDDDLVREIEIIGPLLSIEEPNVVRLVTFSGFNEPVEITEPQV